jgi:Flp pilus assembly protein TadD
MDQPNEFPATEPSPRMKQWPLLIGLILVALIATIYGQTVTFDFVLYDDPEYVTRNPVVQGGWSAAALTWAVTTVEASNWHPLTWLSHMLDCTLFGLDPAGHHLTSVVLHALNSLLLFALWRRMTDEIWPAAFLAATFAVHPMHVESVAWVAERKDVLSTLFFLLATMVYVAYARRGGLARYLGVVALFALGLLSKPMVVTLPLVLLLLDYWPLRRERPWSRLVMEKLPLFALAGVSSVLTLIAQRAGGSMDSSHLVPLYLRIVNATVSYARYVWKILWPSDLSPLYPHPNLAGGTPWSAWRLAAAGCALVLITSLVLAVARRRPYLAVGWAFYLVTLLPVIGLVQVGQQAIADRYTYVPSIGLFLMVAWTARDALVVADRVRRTRWRAVVAALAAAAVIAYSAAAWKQVRYWRDSITLFERALAVSDPTPIMLSNLGTALAEAGRLEEAIDHHRRALEIRPSYGPAQNNLGIALQRLGRFEEAITHLQWAVEIDPGSSAARTNLGAALRAVGRANDAVVQYRQALAIDPESARTHFNLANALLDLGQREQAVEHYRRALEIDPGFRKARESLESVMISGP